MNKALLFLLIMVLVSAVFLTLAICSFVRVKHKQMNCTQKTVGTVFRYSQGDDVIRLPVVEYYVGGKRYTGKRKWRVYKTVQAPWIPQSSAKKNAQKDSLSIKRNNFVFENPMSELYPIGKKLDVFYNPDKPRQNYVELIDIKPSITGEIMFFTGIGFAVIGILVYILLLHVQ